MTKLPQTTRGWLEEVGFSPANDAIWLEALTHGSLDADVSYERLEFLGDRVLGLCMAEWLYQHGDGPEGKLSQRLNALVSRETCARVARKIGVAEHMLLGKQARDDGGADSNNILGDVMEALLGADFLERGFNASSDLIRDLWFDVFDSDMGHSKHPKSALQEWAAGNQRKPPQYELVDRSGPDHAARFTVRVTVKNVGEAEAEATNKQEAEKRAAMAFLKKFG